MIENTLRIAIGGIGHETSAFSPVLTAYDDFQLVRGQNPLEGRRG